MAQHPTPLKVNAADCPGVDVRRPAPRRRTTPSHYTWFVTCRMAQERTRTVKKTRLMPWRLPSPRF
jgi:hypothetical protein